jgi:hypothetical protein
LVPDGQKTFFTTLAALKRFIVVAANCWLDVSQLCHEEDDPEENAKSQSD